MRVFGQVCLLAAFVGAGYGAFASTAGWLSGNRTLRRTGLVSAVSSVIALTGTLVILAWALVARDFSFKYVTQYSSWLLAWHYSLSALWVGQAGSLLLWAWFLGTLALAYRFAPRTTSHDCRNGTFGVLIGCLWFLLAVMVFGADPMEPSLIVPKDGAGLGPLLHHPAMLVHPPIVFIGYAAWTIPFAMAVAALMSGRLDARWAHAVRPWAVFAWTVLGVGILLGAFWAYEELGWGGYWGWDPVENGSLIPWLTGSAFIHALMTWRYCGILKKTAVALAITTFGMCNFATFLTRSGVFSSVHAFSNSPIGWMFLGFMGALVAGGSVLIVLRRGELAADRAIRNLWSREAIIFGSTVLLLLLATVTTVGTLVVPLSDIFVGRKIAVGPEFYNSVLLPTGLLLLSGVAVAPVLRWGRPPTRGQKGVLLIATITGLAAASIGAAIGLRHVAALAVALLAALAVTALIGGLLLDTYRRTLTDDARSRFGSVWATLRGQRRQYAGFLIHIGFVCLAIGVTGSSLGSRRIETVLNEGETIEWAGRSIRHVELVQRELPDKLVAEAVLEVVPQGGAPYRLRPARHLHLLQNEWTTEVSIHSTWAGDFYTILNSGEGEGQVGVTLVENPLMRWIWFGGGVMGVGAVVALWPTRQPTSDRSTSTRRPAVSRPARRELARV
jgi:cytochrome c-type biogenesis protein CcmF